MFSWSMRSLADKKISIFKCLSPPGPIKRIQKRENKAQKEPLTIVSVPLMHEFHQQCTALEKAVNIVTSLVTYVSYSKRLVR